MLAAQWPTRGRAIRRKAQKAEFASIVTRAVAAGRIRADLTYADFPMLACGIIATMYVKPGGHDEWRRHPNPVLDAIPTPNP